MAKKRSKSGKSLGIRIDLFAVLKVFVSLFFIILGIAGIAGAGVSYFSLNDQANTLKVFFGIADLIFGLFLVVSFFAIVPKKTVSLFTLIILIFWLVQIAVTKVLWYVGMPSIFQPTTYAWATVLVTEVIIATNLAIIYGRNS